MREGCERVDDEDEKEYWMRKISGTSRQGRLNATQLIREKKRSCQYKSSHVARPTTRFNRPNANVTYYLSRFSLQRGNFLLQLRLFFLQMHQIRPQRRWMTRGFTTRLDLFMQRFERCLVRDVMLMEVGQRCVRRKYVRGEGNGGQVAA